MEENEGDCWYIFHFLEVWKNTDIILVLGPFFVVLLTLLLLLLLLLWIHNKEMYSVLIQIRYAISLISISLSTSFYYCLLWLSGHTGVYFAT